MFDFLKKRLEQLADSLIDPVWQRILAWSWPARSLILVVAICAAYLATSPESAKSVWSNSSSAIRVIFAGTTTIPIADDISEKMRGLTSRLSATLTPDLDLPSRNDVTPWSTAQIALATHQIGYSLNSNKLIPYFRETAEPMCGCWREIPRNNGKPRNIFISGWILHAMALMGKRATPDELQFLLDEQKQDGSWSVYPVEDDSQYASSYGTAWAILGLNAQLQLGVVDVNSAPKISKSIKRGAAWLIAHREHGSRWKDYPLAPTGKLSESISGVVLHALHITVPQQLEQLDSDWLDGLPTATVKVTDADHPYVYFKTKDGYANDDFVQVRFPWLVIGTVDAYKNGDIIQRAKALTWLEHSMTQGDVLAADTTPDNWWRAELLLSLGYVLERSQSHLAQPIIPPDAAR